MNRPLNHSTNSEDFQGFFQEYATDFLRSQDQEVCESLRRRHIPAGKIQKLEDAYNISLKLGKNVSFKKVRKKVLQQIEAAGYFIRDFHIGILGQHNSIFQLYEIEIAIDRNVRHALSFESGKLFIQIPFWQINFFDTYLSYQELKKRWNQGEHLPSFSPVRKVWWLFNPIGELRSNLRSMLLLAVQRQILGLDKLMLKLGLVDSGEENSLSPTEDGSQEKVRSLKESTIAFLKANVNEEKLGINLDLVLKNQDETTLVQLLGLYKENLADPGQMEELIDAGLLILQDVIQEEQSQVDIKMFGFVNVGNYHRIDVALKVSAGYLRKYVELIPRKAEVKAVQFGFVNVYTIDDITVKPSFHGAMKLNFEAAALERALRELEVVD
ncbi:MAG: hypothetical protein WA919_04725 [Coleofasciculaceae cyanobacterium]